MSQDVDKFLAQHVNMADVRYCWIPKEAIVSQSM